MNQVLKQLSKTFINTRLIAENWRINQNHSRFVSKCVINRNKDYFDPPSNEPPIPVCYDRHNETIDVKKARLVYQSRKRGMLENDLLLGTFAAKYLNTFSEQQLEMYDFLINMPSNDWDLFYWAVGIKPIPDVFRNEVMDLLVEHCKNLDKESRIRQPDL